jgi:hypothetical protein
MLNLLIGRSGEKLGTREISGSRGSQYEDDCLLECCAVMMEAVSTSETSVSFYRLHGATPKKTAISNDE